MTGVAEEWLARAKEDLATVEKLLDDENLSNIAAFHAQQCIEKCFKALIEVSGKPVPRIHDLVRLSALAAVGEEIPADETTLIELSTVYLDARYPVSTGFLPTG
jgi:HEPN domain-containing protein